MLNEELLKEIIEKIKSARIAIVGDFCLDAYFFIDNSASEISVETGLPTMPVSDHRYTLGGAGNLAANIASLEAKEVKVFGVTGNDIFAREMRRIMGGWGIDYSGLVVQEKHWATHVYCKPCIGDKEQSRIDFGNFNRLDLSTAEKVIDQIRQVVDSVDVIVINQQVDSGIHTIEFREMLLELINRYPEKTFIADVRDVSRLYRNCHVKINEKEAASLPASLGIGGAAPLNFIELAGELFDKTGRPLFITRGSKGSVVIDSNGLKSIPGIMQYGAIDTVGAGDSYLAGVAASLAAGFEPGISAITGSFVANVTVKKLFQTGTASPAEVLKLSADPDYIYEPDLAGDIRKAQYLEDTEIEIINRWPDNLKITHAIFDHDGTISTLREGWEKIMAPVMIKAIMGESINTADKTLFDKVSKSVADLIDRTTGVQTLAQMAALADLVRDFGIVPAEEILDMHGYKEIYNRELIELVRIREDKITRGELSVEDYTIKKSVLLLENLYHAGIKLYLASGTDIDDVKHEAGIFGYDRYFEGAIYGSVGDINKEVKKMVLEKILKDIGDGGNAGIVTFGDGPVEIRETRKRGGLTVGLATDEVRRFGLNENKRKRLVEAGADIILPDFSQIDKLLDLLNIR